MKDFFNKLNRKVEKWGEKSVFKNIRITSQVIWNLLLIGSVALLMGIFFAGGAGAGYFMSLVEDQEAYSKEEFEEHIYNYEEISDIYFADKKYLGKIPADLEREELPLEDISEHLINAVISTEDEYFFEHKGIVPKALMRATYQEVTDAATQTGGSTLTQQVIKNQILTNEVSFERKAKEIALALRMEQFLEKDEILEAYLNIVPFGRNSDGRNIAGAQSAAEGIFGVNASDLNIAQAAFIAGLPKNPFTYTPFANNGDVKENFDAALNRKDYILRNMLENNYITKEEYEEAAAYDIKEHLAEPSGSVVEKYPFLTFETQRRAARIIREDLMKEDGIKLNELKKEEQQQTIEEYDARARNKLALGGYNVHLTVKKEIYDAMQESVKSSQWFGPDRQGDNGTEQEETGAIMIENSSGAILSFVGGRDFDVQNLNHATQAYRQNGSTMKPLLAYGPAMDEGIVQPGTVLPDVPSTYSDGTPFTNYGGVYKGFVSVRQALKESRNVPAVRTFQRVDHDVSRQALEKMGFTRLDPNEPFESGAIGGLKYGTTVEQNTNAFTVFGNHGQYNRSYMIDKIETKDGKVVYEHKTDPNQVFSTQTAFLMTDVLRDVLKPGGTAGALPGRMQFGGDWAGKTGTTNDTHDSWFIGFNPNVTFGIWIGYDTPQTVANYYKGLSYGARTQQIWAEMMNAAYQSNAEVFGIEDQFKQPEGIVRQTICGISGKLPSSLCAEAGLTTTDYFNAKYIPSQVDDSLTPSPFVTINGAQYKAYSSTPAEFVHTGVAIKEKYFSVGAVSEYLPDHWRNVVPDRSAPNNGRVPSQVTGVSYYNGILSWAKHPDNDIVGYRVYRVDGTRLRSVAGNTSTSVSIPSGSYFVTAVDSMGRESTSSGAALVENPEPQEPAVEEDPEPEEQNNDNSGGSEQDNNNTDNSSSPSDDGNQNDNSNKNPNKDSNNSEGSNNDKKPNENNGNSSSKENNGNGNNGNKNNNNGKNQKKKEDS
ncbi:transglycosylase domain-containing protein [Bacillus piscicola]|uniref:transglycosylase domain-containing protein n=1 Tax=Bacillus piscicola TaxID=1632684 RepID=UPI001F08B596|nr:transglycosylase domain-containing protein [Bacillus piscicola]